MFINVCEWKKLGARNEEIRPAVIDQLKEETFGKKECCDKVVNMFRSFISGCHRAKMFQTSLA